MLQRCYASDYTRINPSYEDVFVEEFLHGYEDFYEFVNTKKGFKLGYEMDKDLLVRVVESMQEILFLLSLR